MSHHTRLVKSTLTEREAAEVVLVDTLAERLQRHIDRTADEIARLHVFNAQSKVLQAHFSVLLKGELGLSEEVVLTPQDGFVTRARPDFYFALSERRGILGEVERGGTTNNNHDLKDLWKAHIAADAQHLFLIVPNVNWREDGSARERPFPRVAHRLAAFFGSPRRDIDVLSINIFGYGPTGSPRNPALE